MILYHQILDAARSAIGTPFHHQGRLAGPHGGMDCVGLLVHVARTLGIGLHDVTNYKGSPNGMLERILDSNLQPLTPEDAQPGDVLLFKIRDLPQHVAVYSGNSKMIHAEASSGKVTETSYDERWRRRTVDWYGFPGVRRTHHG